MTRSEWYERGNLQKKDGEEGIFLLREKFCEKMWKKFFCRKYRYRQIQIFLSFLQKIDCDFYNIFSLHTDMDSVGTPSVCVATQRDAMMIQRLLEIMVQNTTANTYVK